MDLLRRALLVGCVLPGLWLLRLAPLDPLLSIVPIDFAARQKQEARAIPDDAKTEAQRRMAQIDLSVYIEEVLQYNIFPATGEAWARFLGDIDRRSTPGGMSPGVLLRPDEEPIRAVADRLAAGGGTTYVSMSRPGRDVHYQVVRHAWTRGDFRLGAGFTGTPAPPSALLYPFRTVGYGAMAVGVVLFLLWPAQPRSGAQAGVTGIEVAALGVGLAAFAVPLVAIGGSVQALTRGPFVTAACWLVALAGVHLFASPGRTAPDPIIVSAAGSTPRRRPASAVFLREGAVFLVMAVGPAVFLIAVSMILWNR
jgi:hypothetical protein